MKSNKIAVILDSIDPTKIKGVIYNWSGYGSDNGSKSLLKMIDENSDIVRAEYLTNHNKIIIDISNEIKKKYGKSELIKNLFWSSLTVENSYFKSPQLLNILRLIIINNELKEKKYSKLYYVGSNSSVASSIKSICYKNNIKFFWEKTSKANKSSYGLSLKKLPYLIIATSFLIWYLFKFWKLKKIKKPIWNKNQNSIFCLSYFIHLRKESLRDGKFYSKHWETLPVYLKNLNTNINWMHIFEKSSLVPDNNSAITHINQFNNDNKDQGSHALINSYFGFDIFFKSLFNYFKIYFRTFFLFKKFDELFKSNPYWPILKNDWVDSFLNTVGMQNIIWFHLFDKAISSLPYQSRGIYLCENQGWERIFTYFWKKHSHGKLIGVAHSTISFWDMRFFNKFDDKIKIPKPDTVAVNGPLNWKTLKSALNKMDKYEKVEALRYLYLDELKNNLKMKTVKDKSDILILGDVIPKTTRLMLSCIQENDVIADSYKIIFKPHPANLIDINEYPGLRAEMTEKPLNDLLTNKKIVITSVFTSASVDAYCAGAKVINFLDPENLNFSILRKMEGVKFFSSSYELAHELNQINDKLNINLSVDNFFWIDKDLPKWKKLIFN
tara:strand:+ start:154 stop:1983 length:1830 start_codon:yes stop_codon:yes gene_type:complete